jgi:HK97 family phage prohead protease
MAAGEVSDDKVVRASAWAARHRADLDADGARPGEDGYPTPGAVAHLLWGIPTGARYADAVGWFDRKSEQVKADRSIGMQITPVAPRTKGSDVEFRSFTGELRQEGDGNTFVGYAAVFNSPSEPLPFIERIAPGAFAASITQDDVRALFNHDPNFVIGRTVSGTLSLREDETGLAYDVIPPDTQWARDLMVSVGRGDISQSSFGFAVDADEWTRPERSGDLPLRTIRKARLYDVSPVTYPAYESTTTAVRSAAAAVGAEEQEKENEAALSLVREADRARFDLALSASLTRM